MRRSNNCAEKNGVDPCTFGRHQTRYTRARYMPLMITNSRTVTWTGIGDLTAVVHAPDTNA